MMEFPKKVYYPAIYHPEEDGGYWVSFPDIPEVLSGGKDIATATEMAEDALGIYLYDLEENGESLPTVSNPGYVSVEEEGAFIALIDFDYLAYKVKNGSQAVKKTLTIPSWLNSLAEKENINFSQTLQESLKEKLNV
ncbi:type II toxin-antitoxin system HicB family antitoxin [Paenilisteria weihenstephanensis]|nr:type II toxin-antitoxin system HicB family antitoxin [Listeria weihenstephanensis]